MKAKLFKGKGICGMQLTLSIGDMFHANQMSNTIDKVLKNHKQCEEYEKMPFDKRNEAFPDGKPKRVEVSDKDLNKVIILLNKMSYETDSSMFEEDDVLPETEEVN